VDNYTVTLDYLAASVAMKGQEIGEKLAAHYGGQVELCRPKNGYTFGYKVTVGNDTMCELHIRDGDDPWVFATGSRSQDLADFLVPLQLMHEISVTRMDAALDVFDSEWFPILVEHGKRWATEHGLTTDQRGDWLNPQRGRTWYLGARSSRFFHRIYEKGRKERVDPNWVRHEIEYKPQHRHERLAAISLTAPQVWAMHAGPIFGKILGLDLVQVFDLPVHKPLRVRRDVDRARGALCAQYGNTLCTWLQECGGDPLELVAELMVGIEHQRKVHEWLQAPYVNAPELENPQ
jgi:hypothetical protein